MNNVKKAVGAIIRTHSEALATQWDNNAPDPEGSHGVQVEAINRFLRYNACNDSAESLNNRLKFLSADEVNPSDKSINVWLANFEKHTLPSIVKGEITLNA